jgi:hypothetical protein
MHEFITLAVRTLGATEQTVRSATAGILDLLTRVAPAAEVQQLLSKLPGASDLLNAFRPTPPPPPPPPPASGVASALADLVTNVAAAIQGTVGSGVAIVRLLGELGLDPQKAGQFARLFVDFARTQAGPELVDRIIDAIPGARSFLR